MKNLENFNIQELSYVSLCETFGGAPTKDTSFAYDVCWYAAAAGRACYNGLLVGLSTGSYQ